MKWGNENGMARGPCGAVCAAGAPWCARDVLVRAEPLPVCALLPAAVEAPELDPNRGMTMRERLSPAVARPEAACARTRDLLGGVVVKATLPMVPVTVATVVF